MPAKPQTSQKKSNSSKPSIRDWEEGYDLETTTKKKWSGMINIYFFKVCRSDIAHCITLWPISFQTGQNST